MSIFQYPKEAYFNIVNKQETELGSYALPFSGDIGIANLRVYHSNQDSFDYDMRLVIAKREKGPLLTASRWEKFNNEISGQNSKHWLGDLTFVFDDYAVLKNELYAMRLEVTGYTRIGDEKYMGVWLDWSFPVGINNSGGARIAFGVKR